MARVLVIGAGPAGLMAAEVMARAGCRVVVADRMPSPARKFLMAGKSGLNLTKAEPADAFRAAYPDMPPALASALEAFGPAEVQAWAQALGQPLFTGSTGRVFPEAMKASPLLRAWLRRLGDLGVTLHTRWHWRGWDQGGAALFDTPEGSAIEPFDAALLALGGASWPRLGSDGAWFDMLAQSVPFRPSNVGFNVAWSAHMARHFGTALKNIRLSAGGLSSRGEAVITARGLEGGGIYEVSRALVDGAALTVDLVPELDLTTVAERLSRAKPKQSRSETLRKSLRFDPAKTALFQEVHARTGFPDPTGFARAIKSLPVPLGGPLPITEAISTAGGLRFDALNDQLMFHSRPGVFAAGEMLDWDAPTGGYLLTACLATGAWAGRHAAIYAQTSSPQRGEA